MKEDLYDDLYEEKEEKIDFHALLFRYVIRWPWFVASVIICLAGAWLHLRQTTPVYNISASVIIKDDKKGGNSGGNLAALEGLGLVNSVSNIDNEIEILRSKTLVKHVVSELNLYTTYSVKGSFNEVELYKSSPVLVGLTPQEADRLPGPAVFELTLSPGNRLDVKATVGETSYNKKFSKLPGLLVTPAGTFTFTLAGDSAGVSEPQTLTAVVSNPMQTAKRYAAALSVEPTSKTTSIVIVSLKNTNKRRGEDFINRLIEVYNRNTNNDKNEVAEKTEEFIAGRIRIINDELFSTEKELETFKRDAGLTDLASDAQLAVSENSAYEKQRVENGTQLNLVRYLAEYISAPDKINAVLPVNVGLTDQSLSSLIGQYNEMVLQRNRLLRNSSESNPVIVNLDSGIRAMRENILTTIHSVQKGLLITKADLDRQANKFNRRISNAPAQERQFVSISRQQEIKAGLYLMLLQKREANSIALAATANNAKIVDEAMADNGPVSPKTKTIYMIALVMGIGIPVAIIYVMGLLQFRIEGRADVEKLTSAPIIGDIPLAEEGNGKAGGIAVRENENSLMAETFRGIRTNLQFMLGEENKVILVTICSHQPRHQPLAAGQKSSHRRARHPQAGTQQGLQPLAERKRNHPVPGRPADHRPDVYGAALRDIPHPEHPPQRNRTAQPDRAAGTPGIGGSHRYPEKALRLYRTRHRSHRNGDRHTDHRTGGRPIGLCLPRRLYPQSRLYPARRSPPGQQAPQPVYRNQRFGHEKAEIRLLLWIRKIRPLLRIRKEVRLWLRLRTKA